MIWHSQSVENVLKELHSDSQLGLSEIVAEERLEKSNEKSDKKRIFYKFLSSLKTHLLSVPSILLYIIAAIYLISSFIAQSFSFYFPLLIISLVAIKALFSAAYVVVTALVSKKSLVINTQNVSVLRSGEVVSIPVSKLVIGDIILLSAGDYIPADCRIVECEFLHCDESVFGKKDTFAEKNSFGEALPDFVSIEERYNMIFCGTSVVSGKVKAVVTEIGENTEIAKKEALNSSVSFTDEMISRYESLFRIVKTGCFVALGIVLLAGVVFLPKASGFWKTFLDVLTVVVAAANIILPTSLEEIFFIITSLGLKRISKQGAIVLKPDSITNISNIDVICSDKTGIITRNTMGLSAVFANDTLCDADLLDASHASFLMLSMLSCTSISSDLEADSDPTELAIVNAAEDLLGKTKADYEGMYPSIVSTTYDKELGFKATVNMIDNQIYMIIKGTPDALLGRCIGFDIEAVQKAETEMSQKAMRVLGIAFKKLDELPAVISPDLLVDGFSFVGLLGLSDRVRKHVVYDVRRCADAGITTVMFTGDNINTAEAFAQKSGIAEKDGGLTGEQVLAMTDEEVLNAVQNTFVYAGVNAAAKSKIIDALSQNGNIVAATGDSTDDISPLRTASVGFAIGENCAQSAKASSKVLILDGRFSTIVNTIFECRGIIDNIKKYLQGSILLASSLLTTLLLGFIIFGQSLFSNAQMLFLASVSCIFQTVVYGIEPAETNLFSINYRKKVLEKVGKGIDKNMFICGIISSVFVNLTFLFSQIITKGSGQTSALIAFAFVHVGMLLSVKTHEGLIGKNRLKKIIDCKDFFIISAIYLFVCAITAFTPIANVLSNGVFTLISLPIGLACGILTFIGCEIVKIKAHHLGFE